MIPKSAAAALLASFLLASCASGQGTPTTRTTAVSPSDTTKPIPARLPTSQPTGTFRPQPGWTYARCTLVESGPTAPVDMLFTRGQYEANGRQCRIPASATALIAVRDAADLQGRLSTSLPNSRYLDISAGLDKWLSDWRANGYRLPSGPTDLPFTLAYTLGRQRDALENAFRIGITSRVAEVSQCVQAARDTLIEAIDAQLAALDAATVARAEKDLARADAFGRINAEGDVPRLNKPTDRASSTET